LDYNDSVVSVHAMKEKGTGGMAPRIPTSAVHSVTTLTLQSLCPRDWVRDAHWVGIRGDLDV